MGKEVKYLTSSDIWRGEKAVCAFGAGGYPAQGPINSEHRAVRLKWPVASKADDSQVARVFTFAHVRGQAVRRNGRTTASGQVGGQDRCCMVVRIRTLEKRRCTFNGRRCTKTMQESTFKALFPPAWSEPPLSLQFKSTRSFQLVFTYTKKMT